MAIEVQGSVVARAELGGGRFLLTLAAPDLARLAGPGQFAMVRCAAGWDPYLRRALPFLRCGDPAVSFLFEATEGGLAWLAGRQLGEAVSLVGPLGQGFTLAPGTRRLLLATAGREVAPLLALADVALAGEVSVSLAITAGAAGELAPIIPGAVELLTAAQDAPGGPKASLWELVAATLPWADQVALAGPEEELRRLAHQGEAWRRAAIQCYVQAPLACGLGWCGSCLTETRRGPRRACIGGPVLDLRELI